MTADDRAVIRAAGAAAARGNRREPREQPGSEPAIIQLRPRQQSASEHVLLRIREAADRLGVSSRTMERWVAAGTVPHVRLGEDERIVRIPVDLLDEWWRQRLEGAR
jgi:excisionase family DNA binding protein